MTTCEECKQPKPDARLRLLFNEILCDACIKGIAQDSTLAQIKAHDKPQRIAKQRKGRY